MDTFDQHPRCIFCQNHIGLDSGLSERTLAEKYGVHRKAVYRHKKHLEESVMDGPTDSSTIADEFLDGLGINPNTITSRQYTGKDADGNWQKVAWKPNMATTAGSLIDSQVILDALEGYGGFVAPVTGKGTLLVHPADFQTGKTGSGGDTSDLVRRVRAVYSKILNHVQNHTYAEIVVADLGDVTEGFHNTVQQAQTNDLPLTEQIKLAQRLLIDLIKLLAPHTASLVFVSVSSNHCSVRSGIGSKNRSNRPGDDYGILIHENIKAILADRPEFSHVKFICTPDWEEAVTHTLLDGTVVGFTHGHLAKSQERVSEWFKGQSHGRRSNLHNADILTYGHFHSAHMQMSGDGRYVIGVPSMDNASDYYSNSTGEASPPGLLSFEVSQGDILDWRIWRAL